MFKDKLANISPQKFFVFVALFFGLFYVVLTPIFQGPDEGAHFVSIIRFSNGYISVNKEDGRLGTRGQPGALELNNYYPVLTNQSKYNYVDQLGKMYELKLGKFREKFDSAVPAAPYSPFTYTQYILTFFLGSIIGVSPVILYLLVRLSGLLVWVIFTYFGIKIIPRGKWLLTTLALLPMSLYISSVISADNFVNGLVYLFVALIFLSIYKPSVVSRRYFLVLVGMAILVGLTKQTFFIISLLLLAVPKPRDINKRFFYSIVLLAIFISTLMALYWQFFIGNWSVSPIPGVSSSLQIKHILLHPLGFARTIWNTFLTTSSNPIYISFIGVLGLLDVSLPIWITFGWILLLYKSIGDRSKKIIDTLKRSQKFIFITTSTLLFIALTLGLYLTWTPVGGRVIAGHQGRYLLPLFAILIPVIASKRSEPSKITQTYLIAGILFLEITTMMVFIARYIQIF